jgi:hypothetical protein
MNSLFESGFFTGSGVSTYSTSDVRAAERAREILHFRLLDRTRPPTISKLHVGESDGDGSAETACAFATISEIRRHDMCNNIFRTSDVNLELTCLLFSRLGKAICECKTDLELLRGGRNIFKGISPTVGETYLTEYLQA